MSKTFTITLLCVFASAFLTVLGAIFINTIALTDPLDDLAVPFTIVATLGIALTILGIIGWLLLVVLSTDLPDNKADCPHVMHSWHSKDAAQMKKDYQRALMYGAGPNTASKITGYDPKEDLSPDDKRALIETERKWRLLELSFSDETHEMLARHLSKAGLSPDDKPDDDIAAEAFRRIHEDDDIDQEVQDYMNNHGQGDMTDDEHPNQDEIDFFNNSPPGSV